MNAQIAAQGRATLGVAITAAPFEDLRLAPASIDYVISFHTLEHLVDPVAVMRRIARVLRPDGCVVIEVPGGEEEYANLDHLHFFSSRSLSHLLADCFDQVSLITNHYRNSEGTRIESFYAIGRGVKTQTTVGAGEE